MLNSSVTSTATDNTTRRRDSPASRTAALRVRLRAAYQRLTPHSTAIASSATPENQAMLPWPKRSTTNAAASGPSAAPPLPPTWNTDCASP